MLALQQFSEYACCVFCACFTMQNFGKIKKATSFKVTPKPGSDSKVTSKFTETLPYTNTVTS